MEREKRVECLDAAPVGIKGWDQHNLGCSELWERPRDPQSHFSMEQRPGMQLCQGEPHLPEFHPKIPASRPHPAAGISLDLGCSKGCWCQPRVPLPAFPLSPRASNNSMADLPFQHVQRGWKTAERFLCFPNPGLDSQLRQGLPSLGGRSSLELFCGAGLGQFQHFHDPRLLWE